MRMNPFLHHRLQEKREAINDPSVSESLTLIGYAVFRLTAIFNPETNLLCPPTPKTTIGSTLTTIIVLR